MGRADARTRTALETAEKRLKTIAEALESVKRKRKRETHLRRTKSRRPNLPNDGERLAQVVSMYTYRGTRQLRRSRPQDEGLSLDDLRSETRRLCQVLRVRRLVVEVTDEMATRTARLAATALTRRESMQRSWLQRVSIRAQVKYYEEMTYLCHQGHPSTSKAVRTDTSDVDGDAEGSRSSE